MRNLLSLPLYPLVDTRQVDLGARVLTGEPPRGRRGPEKAASNRRGGMGGWNTPLGRRLEGVFISSSPSHPRALAEAHPSHLRPLAEVR
jgi:hypothetical protein